MPLNIKMPETTEHPDVTAFKQKVAEAARKHSRDHHCGSYKPWLKTLGITDTIVPMVNVQIDFTVSGSDPQQVTKAFPITDLADKSDEEQKTWVAEQIAPKVDVAGLKVTLPIEVLDLNEAAGPAMNAQGLPEGYSKRYTSAEGRVQHILTDSNVERAGERQWAQALCGKGSYEFTEDSFRGENRTCTQCESRLPSTESKFPLAG